MLYNSGQVVLLELAERGKKYPRDFAPWGFSRLALSGGCAKTGSGDGTIPRFLPSRFRANPESRAPE